MSRFREWLRSVWRRATSAERAVATYTSAGFHQLPEVRDLRRSA